MRDPIIIAGAKRTPIGNFQGSLKDVSATQLGTVAIKTAIEQSGLKPNDIHEVFMGCVLPAGLGQAPARQAAIGAGLPVSTGCTTLNKVCGSGMKAVMLAHDTIIAGSQSIVVAGGMESMTNAPYLLPKARAGYRLGHQIALDHMLYDGLEDAYDKGQLMGVFAEDCASQYHYSRETQDQYATGSVQKAQKATADGGFNAEITPVTIVTPKGETVVNQDQGPLTANIEKIPQLKPAFKKDGTITAANASSISDGAAALVVMRLSDAEQRGVKPLARIMGHAQHAQAPNMFSTAPVGAIQKLLQHLHWTVQDVDLFEINEAFAVVALAVSKELNIPLEKVNIHGGACVLGHPIGASGARIIVTLLYALLQKGLKRGIASLCIGGGEATAIAIEIV
jgi:acetyl-CoA C-acetyltransferase